MPLPSECWNNTSWTFCFPIHASGNLALLCNILVSCWYPYSMEEQITLPSKTKQEHLLKNPPILHLYEQSGNKYINKFIP